MVVRIKEGRGRPKRVEYPMEKVTILLRRGDKEWVDIMRGPGELGPLIRELLIGYIDRNQAPEPMDIDETIGTLKDE